MTTKPAAAAVRAAAAKRKPTAKTRAKAAPVTPGPAQAPAPVFFAGPEAFRTWLAAHHATAPELWVGFNKAGSGRGGLTYAGALDAALCLGWIDALRKNIDAHAYTIRFTPRKPGSIWSLINVRHVERLKAAGLMRPAGHAAYAARVETKTGIYAFERKEPAQLPPGFTQKFQANAKAWAFFTAQAPWYQRTAIHKIVSPKQAATRERWLERVIADSAAGRRIDALSRTGTKSSA